MTTDEGVLDPWVAEWFAANPHTGKALAELTPEILELARGPLGFPVTREIAKISDGTVGDVPIRTYQGSEQPTGLIAYFHGGGFCIGSIGLMDNVARELCHATGAVVVSVGYRLAPEDPFPAGLDDCHAVTEWAVSNAGALGVPAGRVAVAGESAGGNLSAAVALRRRDEGSPPLAAQVLMYPGVTGRGGDYPSRTEFDGIVLDESSLRVYWDSYSGDRDIDHEPLAAPIHADSLAGLPPALVVLGGCDLLRDEGRHYAARMRADGNEAEDICYPGQPHGFMNFGFPAAADAYEHIGAWLRPRLAAIPA